MRFVICFFFSLSMFSFSTLGQDSINKRFVLLEYGFPQSNNYYSAREKVGKKWNIQFKRVALCAVGSELEDSVRAHNELVNQQLTNVHGVNWKKRFYGEVKFLTDEQNRLERESVSQEQIEIYKQMHTVEPVGALEMLEKNILFRGYSNKIIAAVTNNGNRPVGLEGTNCQISRPDSVDYFIVRPGKGRQATISLFLIDNDSSVLIRTVEYRVMNLPDPELYFGRAKSGQKGKLGARTIEAKFPYDILEAEFEIRSWSISHGGDLYVGKGSDLSSADKLFKNIKESTGISINAVVRGPDGISRQLSGVWPIEIYK